MAWEDIFRTWGAAPSATEQAKMENAEAAVKAAIRANQHLSGMDISIIPQGSYRSRTNVRQNSDVDICVCLNSTFFPRYPDGKSKTDYGNSDGSISFSDYKTLVHQALNAHFGAANVTPGNKAFDIHSNTYRVDADVVPALTYRYYYGNSENEYTQPTGIAFDTSDGQRIINWPEQAYQNGLAKQKRTGERYRKMARILKRLRYQMEDEGVSEATRIGSFVLESLIWNVPDEGFNHDTYTADVRYVVANCYNRTLLAGDHALLKEVNNIKPIFGTHQSSSREDAHSFFAKAWDYFEFK